MSARLPGWGRGCGGYFSVIQHSWITYWETHHPPPVDRKIKTQIHTSDIPQCIYFYIFSKDEGYSMKIYFPLKFVT